MGHMANIGLYAGTFDPVHNGHIAFARAAKHACKLDKIIFLPEPHPRSKQGVTPINQRIDMLRLAVAPYDTLDVHMLPDAQFTVAATLPKLRAVFGDRLTLLMGSDVARSVPFWPDATALFDAVDIAIGVRANDLAPTIPGNVTIVPAPYANVAASLVRSGISKDIPPEVYEYIRTNHLYVV